MNKYKLLKIIYIATILIIPIFFILLYFLMTETYEDILQHSVNSSDNIFHILNSVYNYIPRIGEFYQRIAVHFMTIQLSFGLDTIFRLFIAFISSALIYFLAKFILKRKPKLNYLDTLTIFAIFAIIIISPLSEIFMARFSYAHNYVVGLLISILFLLIHRFDRKNNIWNIISALVLGFCFSISNEIIPVIYLIMVFSYVFYKKIKKNINLVKTINNYPVQTSAFLGVIFGLIFFYSGAGLSARVGGAYKDVYNYVSVSSIFKEPIISIWTMYKHYWYNFRYLMWTAPLIITSIWVIFISKKYKKDKDNDLFWGIILSSFVFIFMGASSLLALHDDIYVRFLSYPIVAILMVFIMGIKSLFRLSKIEKIKVNIKIITSSLVVVLGIIMLLDVGISFFLYNKNLKSDIEKIKIIKNSSPEIENSYKDTGMKPSLFRWSQMTPFNWGSSSTYLKNGNGMHK